MPRNTVDSLERFAERIEERLRQGKNQQSIENLACRLLTHKDPRVREHMVIKWAEWRYGRAKETIEFTGEIRHEFDPTKLTDEQLAQARQLVESALVGSDQG